MFDGAQPIAPAFFEFFQPVFFDGVGYVDKVAIDEQFADPKCPTVREYVAAADGYLFRIHNGAHTCVSSANVKFLAGKLAGVVDGAGDGEKDGVRGKGVASDRGKGSEQQTSSHDVPLVSATPDKLSSSNDNATEAAHATKAPKRPQPKRGGAW